MAIVLALMCCATTSVQALPLVAFGPGTALPVPSLGQPATGIIVGRVIASDTQEPIAGAIVRLLPADVRVPAATTGDDGRFVLRGIAPGIARIEVRRIGYRPLIQSDIAVSAGKPADVTISLASAPAALANVVVRPTYFPSAPLPGTPVSTVSFTAEEVRRAPGGQEDVVRALSVLPGVSGASAPNQNDLIVRGGAPVENLFVIDNVEVPNINHFGTQGSTGGALSLLNIQFVRDASLSAGGFGVRYGDRTSSVTNIALQDGSKERGSRELTISATGGSAIVQGPIGSRTTYLAGIRRSYLDLVFAALGGISFVPRYTDLTLKVTTEPSARDRLSFFTIGAVDRFKFDNSTAEGRFDNSRFIAPQQDQYFSGLTWRRSIAHGAVTTTLGRTWTRFETVQSDSGSSSAAPMPVFRATTQEGENSLRTDAVVQYGSRFTVEAGNVLKVASRLRYDVALAGALRRDQIGNARELATDTTMRALRNATYAQLTAAIASQWRVTVGARADYYQFLRDAVRFAPRATVSFMPNERSTFTLAGGRYWQAPPTIWLVGDSSNRSMLAPWRADQLVLGGQQMIRPDLRVQVEAYVKRYGAYPSRRFRPQAVLQPGSFDDASTDIPFGLEPLTSTGTGTAVGLEALVQKRLSEVPIYGVFSMSVSRTRFAGLDRIERRGAYDSPIAASGVLGWRPNAKWEFATRSRVAAGVPTTPFIVTGPDAGRLDFSRYTAGPRLPTYFSLDARADRRFQLGRRQQLITYIDVQNITNRENITRISYNARLGGTEREANIGFFPTIGVNWTF